MSKGKWLLFFDSMTSLEEFFADIYIPLDSEFVVARSSNGTEDGDSGISVVEVYNPHPNQPLRENTVATWSSGEGLIWTPVSFFDRRGDLQGISLKCVMVKEVGNKFARCQDMSQIIITKVIVNFHPPLSQTRLRHRKGARFNKIYCIPQPPYIQYPKDTALETSHVSGYSIQFLDLFKQKMNFT